MPERDQRDPSAIGTALLDVTRNDKIDSRFLGCTDPAAVADILLATEEFPDFDDDTPGPLERYGDPRLIHHALERSST